MEVSVVEETVVEIVEGMEEMEDVVAMAAVDVERSILNDKKAGLSMNIWGHVGW